MARAAELGELSRSLFLEGLWQRFPDRDDAQLRELYLERLDRFHDRRS